VCAHTAGAARRKIAGFESRGMGHKHRNTLFGSMPKSCCRFSFAPSATPARAHALGRRGAEEAAGNAPLVWNQAQPARGARRAAAPGSGMPWNAATFPAPQAATAARIMTKVPVGI